MSDGSGAASCREKRYVRRKRDWLNIIAWSPWMGKSSGLEIESKDPIRLIVVGKEAVKPGGIATEQKVCKGGNRRGWSEEYLGISFAVAAGSAP